MQTYPAASVPADVAQSCFFPIHDVQLTYNGKSALDYYQIIKTSENKFLGIRRYKSKKKVDYLSNLEVYEKALRLNTAFTERGCSVLFHGIHDDENSFNMILQSEPLKQVIPF